MFNNGQPQQAQHYTPEQLLQFAAVQQQQQQQFGLNFNQNPLLYSQGGHPPTHIQTPQNHQMVQQIQQQLAAGQQVGVSVQQQQQINPIFFNQFLAQHQAQQQVQAFGAPQVNAHAQLEFQQSFQTNFEAIQRLQALTAHANTSNAMQTDENDFTAQLLAQQTALLQQQQQQQQHNNAMDTSMSSGPPPASHIVHPPTPQIQHQKKQHTQVRTHKPKQQQNHHNMNSHNQSAKSTIGVESLADSALGSNNSGSSSLGHDSGKDNESSVSSPQKSANSGNGGISPQTTGAQSTPDGINMTATKFPILAANPQVHVPCTAKCYHRCKLGLACPRHAHKHLEKLQRKQKAAAGEPVPPSGKCGERKPKDSSGRLKSIETITSGSCISNSGSSVLSALTGEKSKIEKNGKRTFLDLYEVYNVIGVGGGGMVYSGRRIADKLPVAIKRVMREKVKRWETVQGYQVPQEIALMLRCYGHPGVIRLVDWYECLDSFILIMERPERAVDLFDYIREVGRITERDAAKIFKRIVDATIHIQKCGVVHRDIKDENIIINRDTGEAKLIDFGCGTLLRDTAYRDFSGTPEFYPPEWFTQREYYARTAAVWSLGVLLFDMLQGEIPFKQKEKIVENNPNYKNQITPEAKHLIQWLMSTNPKERPSIHEISSHPWLVQNLN
jgi:hypothetical protein